MSEADKKDEVQVQTFEVEGKTYTIGNPSKKDLVEYNKLRNKLFVEIRDSGAPLKTEVNKEVKEEWTEKDEAELLTLQKELVDGETRLNEGGFALEDAITLAKSMVETRNKFYMAISRKSSLGRESVEEQVENASFLFFVYALTRDADGKRVWKSYDEYMEANDELSEVATAEVYKAMHGDPTEIILNTVENQFLKEFNIELDEDKPVERKPFLDADGNPVQPKPKSE